LIAKPILPSLPADKAGSKGKAGKAPLNYGTKTNRKPMNVLPGFSSFPGKFTG